MKLQSALKKIDARAKKVGVEVSIREDKRAHDSLYYIRFEGSNQSISFYSKCNGEDNIHLIKVTRDGDVSDPQTDYFAGTFADNLTQALNWCAPLPPKYPAGSLVRFKDNKRNGRSRLTGIVALVIEAKTGGNYKVQYAGQKDRYHPYFSERDLERIS
jgi:hypothetical protein